jgi:hypothetical protein
MQLDRQHVLEDVLAFTSSMSDLRQKLGEFPWDSDNELVQLGRDHVRQVLRRYIGGELTRDDVEAWADLLEGRDDVGLEAAAEPLLKDVIYELANPTIMPELTPRRAQEILTRLGGA